MPCPSIINTYSICHHTIFFQSNVVLVHQTSKRKRVIAEPEGVPAKSLKNMVVPEKSESTPLLLVVQPMTQNVGPTPAHCTHTSLSTPLASPYRTCTPAKGTTCIYSNHGKIIVKTNTIFTSSCPTSGRWSIWIVMTSKVCLCFSRKHCSSIGVT